MKIALNLGLFIALLSSGLFAAQQQSVTEPTTQPQQATARHAGEQKKQAPKVWDNDNIPRDKTSVSVIGPPPPPDAKPTDAAGAGHRPAQNAKDPSNTSSPPEKKALEGDLGQAKDQLRSLQDDLTILQRKYVVDHQTYYTKPNYAADKDGAASLKDEQDEMAAKAQKVAEQQKKVEDLQAALNSPTGGSPNPPK